MPELNPYARFLDGRPLETILAHTAHLLEELTASIGLLRSTQRPAPGKWSAAEILCHLADCELVFAFRLRQTLAEDSPIIQPFDQDKWAAGYGALTAAQALYAFSAIRHWNLLLIHASLPSSANRPVTHPERGVMTFQTLVETMAGHDLNHIAQLKRLV